MIAFKINDEYLDLESGTSIEIKLVNPLFNNDFEQGMLTYDFNVKATPKNLLLLAFAGHLSLRTSAVQALPCQMWLNNQLWRVGKLQVLERTEKNYRVNFQSDAGALDELAEDRLREIDLGSVQMNNSVKALYPVDKVAQFPVRNTGFYKEPPVLYSGTMNNFLNGFNEAPKVPFPYLVHVLHQLMAAYGWTVKGQWLEEEATRRRVIFNTVAVDNGEVVVNRHVPDLTAGEFLKAIRKRYGLGLVFRTKSKELELVRLQDALKSTSYQDWTWRVQRGYTWAPNKTDGFTLREELDSEDDLQKELTEDYGTLVFGNGKEVVETGVGSTTMETLPWGAVVPGVSQLGGSYEEPSKFSFRVLSYRGLVDNAPAAENETWDDLQDALQEWYTWKGQTELIQRTVNLHVSHLLELDPLWKIFVRSEEGTVKAFWSEIDITVSLKDGIRPAKVKFLKIMQ
ncbi:hypothetical protein [Pontibacter sp. SGAir0037]|uniref:hypothetical protein n=1 Tax=Pontibacter sp. SGAir0037 TaxID=2571030 RepID=UPI0010CCE4F1|nr:hypothetical protein [Pontibacter sp. SGAir0037]QCR23068.1 hypothetical protein C1N53_12420 [Pontibacter sp. SGAir0037]